MSETRGPVRLFYSTASSSGTREAFDMVWGAKICPECFSCRGELEVWGPIAVAHENVPHEPNNLVRLHQRCSCEDHSDEERWPEKDFNTYLELCFCCGAEAIRSGSRWSVYYCDDCKRRVCDLNRALGRWVIPIGRHTAMHGVFLGGKDVKDEKLRTRFTSAMFGLFAAADRLREWRRSIVRETLGELGFPPCKDVLLVEYLTAARAHVDQERVFERLCDHFASPN